jgi:predicted ATPase
MRRSPCRRSAGDHRALLDQLGSLAAHQPVLVLEDSQWLDPTSTELFERAIERWTLPVLLLISPGIRAALDQLSALTSLTLNRLGRRHSSGRAVAAAAAARRWRK